MRELTIPGLGFLGPRSGPDFRVQDWLRDRAPELAKLDFIPDPVLADFAGAAREIEGRPLRYSVGMWVHRCAANWGLSSETLLSKWIKEQGGPRAPGPFRLEVKLVRRDATDMEKAEMNRPPNWKEGRTWSTFQDTGGFLTALGDQVMFAACGFAVPDPHSKAPWNLEAYHVADTDYVMPAIGWAHQMALTAWFIRRRLDRYVPGMTEKLYSGETVIPADPYTAVSLRYTPSEEAGLLWAAVYRSNFGVPA